MLAATSIAAALACGSDDDDGDNGGSAEVEETLPLDTIEPVEVPERPAAVPTAPIPGGATPNGLNLPTQLANWSVIGVVNVLPTEAAPNSTVRVVLGNDIAVQAARSGQTNPWPENSMIGHLQWAAGSEPASGTAVTPGAFARATVMMKDSTRFEADGGWAYGVWAGLDLTPPAVAVAPAPAFDRACVDCHTSRVQDEDYVFTIPGVLPAQADIDGAAVQPNGVEMPAGILSWRVIGIASRENDANPTIRVIVGNDIAVEAARSGDTDPWPDGAMLAHYSWVPGDNENAPDTVTPVSFAAITLMVKDSVEFEEDGGWAYGAWAGPGLTPLAADADQGCVDCHVASVPTSDYVFTVPGELPELFKTATP